MRLIASIIATTFMLFVFSACSNENSNSSINEPNSTNQLQHYEIELNMNNFEKYILYSITEASSTTIGTKGDFYDFQGVLSYAYYKDVIITLDAQYKLPSWEGGETHNINFDIELNAAGNFGFYADNQVALDKLNWTSYPRGTTSEIAVTAVSGTVIFNI